MLMIDNIIVIVSLSKSLTWICHCVNLFPSLDCDLLKTLLTIKPDLYDLIAASVWSLTSSQHWYTPSLPNTNGSSFISWMRY